MSPKKFYIEIKAGENKASLKEFADEVPTLDELHKTVNGQSFETVSVRSTNLLLVCDEEALLKDKPVLNELASKLAGTMIYGDVGILSFKGEDLIGLDFFTALDILTIIKICLID